jgi:hypothetical protein
MSYVFFLVSKVDKLQQDEEKQNKNTTQYVLNSTMRKPSKAFQCQLAY